MAVYRQIQISYWQDSFVLKLTPEEKFFYLYLLTNSKTKQCGIYELPLQVIQMETGYDRETVIKLIQKFIDHRKVKYDWENEEVFLLNWIKHNPFDNNPRIKTCIEKELLDVHNQEMIPPTSPLQALLQKEEKEKEEQKEKEEEIIPTHNLEKRMNDFELEVMLYKGEYPKEMLQAFWDYWSEPNPSQSKMRKELQKTWDTKRRIKTWSNNNFGNKNGTNKSSIGASPEFLAGLVADRFKKERD